MKIIRGSASAGFTRIPNTALRDKRLSYKARGLLATLLSHVDGWQIDAHDLAADSPDGRTAVLSGLKELVKYGYIVYENRRGADGRMEKVMTVYEVPRSLGPVDNGETPGHAEVGKPDLGSPDPGPEGQDETPGHTEVRFPDVGSPNVGSPSVGSPDLYRRPREDQKKISPTAVSQSAGVREATRWLHARYRLTDAEAAQVIEEAHRRAPTPIRNLVLYLNGMAEDNNGSPKGDLADIVAAVMDSSAAEPQDDKPRLTAVPEWCRSCDRPDSRFVELDDGRVVHCPTCHPGNLREAS